MNKNTTKVNRTTKFLDTVLMGAIIALSAAMIIVAMLGLFATPAKAEYSVGFAAGSTTGVGATFRYLDDDSPWGWQVTGLPVIHPDNGVVSLGGSALYILNRGREVAAYTSFGIGGLATWEKCTEEDDIFCEDESHQGFGVGPGIGFELRMLDNVAFSVDVPLALIFADGEFHGLLPVPNAALVYYWK